MRELKATERTGSDSNLKIIEKHAPDAKSDIAVDSRLTGGPLGRNAKQMAPPLYATLKLLLWKMTTIGLTEKIFPMSQLRKESHGASLARCFDAMKNPPTFISIGS